MPQTQAGLPFAESDHVHATHASYCAAVHAQSFAPGQLTRYVEHLLACGESGADDREAHQATGISRAALCLRRHDLGLIGAVVSKGQRRHRVCLEPERWRTFAVWILSDAVRGLTAQAIVARVGAVRRELVRVRREQARSGP